MLKTTVMMVASVAIPFAVALAVPTQASALQMDCWPVYGLSHANVWCHVIHDDGSDEWILSR